MQSRGPEQVWQDAMSALLDGEEPPVLASALADHLSNCDCCSTWLDENAELNSDLRALPLTEPHLGEAVVNSVDVHLCACRDGGQCLCGDCQCGPSCTCHHAEELVSDQA